MDNCTCPAPVCGDGICNGDETYETCDLDCVDSAECGDGVCDSEEVCCIDCGCPEGQDCVNNECVAGGQDLLAGAATTGEDVVTPVCGDGICDSGEDCEQDCHCGNGKCERKYEETKLNCPNDCEGVVPFLYLDTTTLGFVVGILIIIGIIYFMFVYVPEQKRRAIRRRHMLRTRRANLARTPGHILKVNSYINSCLKRGYKPHHIREALLRKGWERRIIDELFRRKRLR